MKWWCQTFGLHCMCKWCTHFNQVHSKHHLFQFLWVCGWQNVCYLHKCMSERLICNMTIESYIKREIILSKCLWFNCTEFNTYNLYIMLQLMLSSMGNCLALANILLLHTDMSALSEQNRIFPLFFLFHLHNLKTPGKNVMMNGQLGRKCILT